MGANENTYQLVVIGGGPGGYAAAFRGADLGMDVALIDREPNPGGVCLYQGCIPSKALLHVARVMSEVGEAREMGIEYEAPKIDLDKLRSWKSGVVERLTGGLGQLAGRRGVSYVQGTASFAGSNRLVVENGGGEKSTVSFEHAIVATGSRPAVIPALDIDSPRVWGSREALEMRSIPDTMLVVGGGYIGLELGSVYATLGARVSVVEMMPGLLPGADRDLVAVLEKRAKKLFETIRVETRVTAMKVEKKAVRVEFDDGATSHFDAVLVSVGRSPNSGGLGLEHTGVVVGDKGFIEVDERMRTGDPSISAIGDVVGEPMLAHKASHEGLVAVEAIAGEKVAFEPRAIPAVIFTDPEIAWCGLTESEAKKTGVDYTVAKFPWAASGRAMTLDRVDGLTKLLIDPQTDRILGVGIVGVGAGDMIAEGVLAIEMGANATDIKLSIHPHPTLSETVMEAAEVYFGQSTHVYRPRRK